MYTIKTAFFSQMAKLCMDDLIHPFPSPNSPPPLSLHVKIKFAELTKLILAFISKMG